MKINPLQNLYISIINATLFDVCLYAQDIYDVISSTS
jgi:hypothetical protein